MTPLEIIQQALQTSGQSGYTGVFHALGGGEGNDTYLLEFEEGRQLILRVARYKNQDSLIREGRVLEMLHFGRVPQLVYFDAAQLIDDRHWILETYVRGSAVERLSPLQLTSLGALLAQVHQVKRTGGVDAWGGFLNACKKFGSEPELLAHPDKRLRELIHAGREYCNAHQSMLDGVVPSLIHGDATPSNVLVDGDSVALIDWEFSSFGDPMAEFSTIYYDDMEYNKGKWRMHITPQEREALFAGYTGAGGVVDMERVALWMVLDKLGAALFLYWRLYQSGRTAEPDQAEQYRLDLNNLELSLQRTLH